MIICVELDFLVGVNGYYKLVLGLDKRYNVAALVQSEYAFVITVHP